MVKVLLAGNDICKGIETGLSHLGITTERLSENDSFPDLELFSAVYFSGKFPAGPQNAEKTEAVAKELCRRCADFSVPVVFDPDLKNISPEKYSVITEIAALGVIFVPDLEEGKALCGKDKPEDIAKHFLETGTSKIVIKLDKRGAYYKSAKESGYAPTFRADKVVDTDGAGDAFSSGLISGITEEIPLSEAVVRANACGCIAIQTEGDLDCLPTIEKVRDYMLNHRFVVDGCKFY